MADADESLMVIDADALVESEPAQPAENTEADVVTTDDTPAKEGEKAEGEEEIAKVFTAVDQDGAEVQYVTMTQEEAEAAGVEEDDQVVTTSLQFDPANPSVLYTADGTPINQADLSPEEQALVQAALQQHLAEQEAEQQLALIEQTPTDAATTAMEVQDVQTTSAGDTADTSTATVSQEVLTVTSVQGTTVSSEEPQQTTAENTDPVAVITPVSEPAVADDTSRVDIISSTTTASSIVQSLADSVRREQEYKKAQDLIERAGEDSKSELPEGYKYEEKIVIRQGQPHVVKVPVRAPAQPKRPEIPAVLANLMPKVEVGKDGSQVIRIHQSQITADQLKSLQENPNVRLVFRPASSSRGRSHPYNLPRKRGRPRKNYVSALSPALNRDNESALKTSRYGRTSKAPYYQKDYLGGDLENGDLQPEGVPARRGRPPGSYRRGPGFSRNLEQLREQEFQHDEELNNARLSIVPQKPVLSGVELAISTRRKNRLRELLSACSEDEIMEVALPHLARVFSLWEFLVMKVEKNKLSRVYFADVYKEYEILHRYVSRLTDKYKQALMQEKLLNPVVGQQNGTTENEDTVEKEKKNIVKVRCKLLAQSLGLDQDELEDAFITLLDAEEVIPPPPKPVSETKDTTDSSRSSTKDVANDKTGDAEKKDNTPALVQATETERENKEKETGSTEVTSQEESTEKMETEKSDEIASATDGTAQTVSTEVGAVEGTEGSSGGTQIIQIGTGDDKQFIEVPEGYTLIQTPEGLVMSQPGTTLSQAEDGTIYVTHEDGTTSTLDSQKAVPLESFESLLTEEQQQQPES